MAKGKRPPLVKGRGIQRVFFQETNKTEGAAYATFDLGKHYFFHFVLGNNYRMKRKVVTHGQSTPFPQWRKENLKIKRSAGCRMGERREISKWGVLSL